MISLVPLGFELLAPKASLSEPSQFRFSNVNVKLIKFVLFFPFPDVGALLRWRLPRTSDLPFNFDWDPATAGPALRNRPTFRRGSHSAGIPPL